VKPAKQGARGGSNGDFGVGVGRVSVGGDDIVNVSANQLHPPQLSSTTSLSPAPSNTSTTSNTSNTSASSVPLASALRGCVWAQVEVQTVCWTEQQGGVVSVDGTKYRHVTYNKQWACAGAVPNSDTFMMEGKDWLLAAMFRHRFVITVFFLTIHLFFCFL
jgi:hypothetical protein